MRPDSRSRELAAQEGQKLGMVQTEMAKDTFTGAVDQLQKDEFLPFTYIDGNEAWNANVAIRARTLMVAPSALYQYPWRHYTHAERGPKWRFSTPASVSRNCPCPVAAAGRITAILAKSVPHFLRPRCR